MKPSEEILTELKGLSTAVAAIPRVNVFTVDTEYFNSIYPELKARISADAFYTSRATYSIPEGYFEELVRNVLQKIHAEENSVREEIMGLSPFIAGISNRNVFTVPNGYFEGLNGAVKISTPAKIIKMNQARAMFKYAAAAVITGLLGISVINIVDNNRGLKDPIEQTAETGIKTNDILKTGNFDKELNSLSDNEIVKYLKESGDDINAALVATSVNEGATLPEPTDYLTDENTLDNYLNENNLKN